jgi:hypothetical protein
MADIPSLASSGLDYQSAPKQPEVNKITKIMRGTPKITSSRLKTRQEISDSNTINTNETTKTTNENTDSKTADENAPDSKTTDQNTDSKADDKKTDVKTSVENAPDTKTPDENSDANAPDTKTDYNKTDTNSDPKTTVENATDTTGGEEQNKTEETPPADLPPPPPEAIALEYDVLFIQYIHQQTLQNKPISLSQAASYIISQGIPLIKNKETKEHLVLLFRQYQDLFAKVESFVQEKKPIDLSHLETLQLDFLPGPFSPVLPSLISFFQEQQKKKEEE